jgi:flagellar export protein FliJ
VVRERQRASDSDIGRLAFPSFLQSIDTRRKNILNTQQELERERSLQQDDLTAAFQDLKSFEIAEEERVRRAAEAEAHAAQSRLDEIAMARHLRKHSARQA